MMVKCKKGHFLRKSNNILYQYVSRCIQKLLGMSITGNEILHVPVLVTFVKMLLNTLN